MKATCPAGGVSGDFFRKYAAGHFGIPSCALFLSDLYPDYKGMYLCSATCSSGQVYGKLEERSFSTGKLCSIPRRLWFLSPLRWKFPLIFTVTS